MEHKHDHLRARIQVYGGAWLTGSCVVSFPASASYLSDAHGVRGGAYAALFLPQLAGSLLGARLGARWSERGGEQRALRAALAAFAGAELALAASALGHAVFPLLLLGTALAGLGFGLAAAPLNALALALSPERGASALVAAHAAIGLGFAAGPLLLGAFTARGSFGAGPLLLALLAVALALPAGRQGPEPAPRSHGTGDSPRLIRFVAIAFAYALAEGTFANWVGVFLHGERGLTGATAALALSAFWAALVIGRALVSLLLRRVPAAVLWLALPPWMAAAFLAIPLAVDRAGALSTCALAGLGFGGFFPLTVGRAIEAAPTRGARVSAVLSATLMVGAGAASFAIGPLQALAPLSQLLALSALEPLAAWVLVALVIALPAHSPRTTAS